MFHDYSNSPHYVNTLNVKIWQGFDFIKFSAALSQQHVCWLSKFLSISWHSINTGISRWNLWESTAWLSVHCRWPEFHSWQGFFFSPQCPNKLWGPPSLSCPMGSRTLSPEVKQLGHEADHSPPSNAEVKYGGAIPPLPHMPSWCGA
jgi:hypothetical protein